MKHKNLLIAACFTAIFTNLYPFYAACSLYTCTNCLQEKASSIRPLVSSLNGIIANHMGEISRSPDTLVYDSLKANDVIINEIMADPTPVVGLPPYEYIELHNRTDRTIDLTGWTLDIGTRRRTFTALACIEPYGYLIVTDTAGVKYFNTYGKTYGFSSLIINNTGQEIVLKNDLAQVVNAVSFTDSWYDSDYKSQGGWSLEQVDPANPCGGEDNWKASVDLSGGTPGKVNSVNAANPDDTPPELDRACALDSTDIELFFSEPLDSIGLNNTSEYYIDNNIGVPVQVMLVQPFYNSLILKLGSTLKKSIIYTVTITKSFSDCAGNQCNSSSGAEFAIPEPAQPNDIIINEILTNPKDNGAEFVEVYNRSQKVIDLKDLLLTSFDSINNILISEKTISADGYLIFPGQYCALTISPETVKRQYFTPNPKSFIQLSSFPQYDNDHGIVVIADKPGQVIDKLVYTPDMQYPLLADTKGVSLERIYADKPTCDKTNWHSAAQRVGYATPAYKNSESVSDIITDNAVTVSPEIFSPDNDGHDDILTISYNFKEPGYLANVRIYDSRGRTVRKLINNELIGAKGSFIWNGINDRNQKALIGIYIVYFEVHNLNGDVKHYKLTAVLAGKLR